MQATQILDKCPNCDSPRAGVQDGVVIYRCGSEQREETVKPGQGCRKVILRLRMELDGKHNRTS